MKFETWKKKEPENKFTKKELIDQKAINEQRVLMDLQSKSKVRFHVLSYDVFKDNIKSAKSFIVYLNATLSIEEIQARMQKGFGDL